VAVTPTTDELRALVERLERGLPKPQATLSVEYHVTNHEALAAAALRLWIAERERADAIEMISKEADESAMKHWPCNNPDRSDA